MPRITSNQLGVTDAHTHAGGIDWYNLFKTRHPISQSVRDLVLKAQMNNIHNLVVFPMPMPLYYHPLQLIQSQNWQPSGLESFPYELSNKALLYEASVFGQGMVLPFMAIDPKEEVDKQIAFLDRAASQDVVYGLKLHTRATGSTATDLVNSPFVDLLRKYNLPILIHSGISPSYTNAIHILELAGHHADIRICIAHLAALDKSILSEIPNTENVYVDSTPFLTICKFAREGTFTFISNNTFDTDYQSPAKCLVDLNNAVRNRLVWGTDEPWSAISDTTGQLITSNTYADECAVLVSLVEKGYERTKEAIAKTNTARFLFGDGPKP